MPECRCPPRPPSPPSVQEEDKHYSQGEVYGTWESVYTAVYDIPRAHDTDLGASLYRASLKSYNTLASKARAIPNPRPCIMMDWQNETPKGRRVCFATTLRGSKLSAMPEVFQHFCIPIYPHDTITRKTPYHLHSEPKWEKENAWVIAWAFHSKSELSGLWMDSRPVTIAAAGEPQPWFFGRAAMTLLQTECRRRRISWSKKCSNRETAMIYFAQVKVSVANQPYWEDNQVLIL